ncbi:MAG: flagellar hook assembly protein FlgD [Colwellia sp.]
MTTIGDTSTESSVLSALSWQKKDDYSVTEADNGILTQEDFFALLTQQLSNQDPTKPADNNEMIAQMSAFSTTEGIQQLNDSFDSFAISMTSSQALQASSLVGRSVLVEDSVFGTTEGQDTQGKLFAEEGASKVYIYIENIAGEVVQTVDVGDVKAGEFGFTWDGKTSNGETAPTGAYRFRAVGLVSGDASELEIKTYRKVDSVTLAGKDGNIMLNLNGGSSMNLADVFEIADG